MISNLISLPAAGSAPAVDVLTRVTGPSSETAVDGIAVASVPGVLPVPLPPAFAQYLGAAVNVAVPDTVATDTLPADALLALPVAVPQPVGEALSPPADDAAQPVLPALGPDLATLAQLMPTLPMPVAPAPAPPAAAAPTEADTALPLPVVQALAAANFVPASQVAQPAVAQVQAAAPKLPDSADAATPEPAKSAARAAAGLSYVPAKGQAAGSSDTAGAETLMPAQLPRWSASVLAATSVPMQALDASLTLNKEGGSAWQQPLLQALGDRLQVQIATRSEQTRLQLEPPQLGRIEIEIRQQGGALQVQLSATHDEVRQQLRQISEPLRHDLVQRHSGEVSVQVAAGASTTADSRGRDGGQPQGQSQGSGSRDGQQRQPGRAWDMENDGVTAFHEAYAGQGQV